MMQPYSFEVALARIRETGRQNLYVAMALSAALPCALLAFRMQQYDSLIYGGMGWNLILAGIPFVISQWLVIFSPRSALALGLGLFVWLIFFPNAPYLVTDLKLLTKSSWPVPFWFDIALLSAFAWNGLMLGFLSLFEVQSVLTRRYGGRWAWTFACGALVLGSAGIYIGRFLRWNSWDVLFHPVALLSDVGDRLLHPFQDPSLYGVTIVYAAFLIVGYVLLRSLIDFAGAASTRDLRPVIRDP